MRTIGSLAVTAMLFFAGMLGIISFVSEDVSALSWNIEIVDSGGVKPSTSIALDSKGYPHISYYGGSSDLKYANWTGTQWMRQTLDSAGLTGVFSSIALDNNDYPHISYIDRTNYLLKYATWNGTGWNISVVEAIGANLISTSIALNGSGYPRIGYHNSIFRDLRYAVWNGTAWNIDIVDPGLGMGQNCLSMVLDGNYDPHFSYCDALAGTMKYAKWTGSTWSTGYVVTSPWVNAATSIAVDSTNKAHISYFLDAPDFDLAHSWWTGSTWGKDLVDTTGWMGTADSLAIDNGNTPHICYLSLSSYDLIYANWTGSGWDNYTVDNAGSVGGGCSIALDVNGYPHIAYNDQFSQILKYARYGAPPATTPSAPRSLQATGGDAQVQLDWIAPASDGGSPITNYRIYRGTTPGGEVFLDEIGNVLTYLDSGVTNGQIYYHKVSAVNALGESPLSNEASATPGRPPGPPLGLVAGPGNQQVALNWTAPTDDGGAPITGYAIYRGTTSGGATPLTTIGNLLNYVDISVTNGVKYYYQVAAVNSYGEGSRSNEANATSTAPPGAPIMLDARLTGQGLENVTVTWSLSADDGTGQGSVVGYAVYRNLSYDPGGLGYSLIATLPNGTSSFTDSYVGEGHIDNFFYRMCAVDVNSLANCSMDQGGKYIRILSPGPNLVSIPLIQSVSGIQTVLQTMNWDKAWTYDSSTQDWKSHMKFKPYLGDLKTIGTADGIWVNVISWSNLTVAGIVPSVTNITLHQGWNLVGFPSFDDNYMVSDLKLAVAVERIEGFDGAVLPYFLRAMTDGDFLQAGFGYWIKVESPAIWTVENV